MLLKREAEIQDLVKTVRAYSEEKKRLVAQLEAASSNTNNSTTLHLETSIQRLKTENSTLTEKVKSLTTQLTTANSRTSSNPSQ